MQRVEPGDIDALRQAVDATGDEPLARARAVRVLTDALVEADRPQEAVGWGELAADLYRRGGDLTSVARCDHDLGILRYELGDVDGALTLFAAARKEFLAARRTTEVAACDFNLGFVLHEAKALDDAIECMQLARGIFEATGRPADVAACNQNLAAALWEMGRGQEARSRLEDAAATYERLGDAVSLGECEQNLAVVSTHTGHTPEAPAHAGWGQAPGVPPLELSHSGNFGLSSA